MSDTTSTYRDHPDVSVIRTGGREILLVGTAHISQESADLVRNLIEQEKPDCVCVELDEARYKALSEKNRWENLDLKSLIVKKQLSTLMVNLLLGSYQKKLGDKLGVAPGTELLEATKAAKESGIPIALCDRDVRITLRRAWASMSFWEKTKLMTSGLAGIFVEEEISEESLSELRNKDVLNEMIQELGEVMPAMRKVLIDERDTYLAQKILESEGETVVAVVGAGHREGIIKSLTDHKPIDLAEIEVIPPSSPVWKILGWGIPLLILGSIAYIGYSQGFEAASDNLIFWILANGIPSAIGAVAALAHPLTILASFVAAPITSLTPVIGAGYVAAFVQAYFVPPVVKEFQSVTADAGTMKLWWSNRLLRIMLVFILTGLGSMLGTYLGLYEIISNVL